MAFLAIIGIDVHRRPLAELERAAKAGGDAVGLAGRARAELAADEAAALLTCNRIELLVAAEQELAPTAIHRVFEQAVATRGELRVGEAALRHLLRIACSLESAALGEEQILGQVRDAARTAHAARLAGPRLAAVFDLALQVGKKVRRETDLGGLGTDLARLALKHLKPELRAAEDAPPLLLLGTGRMARALLAARPKDARDGWQIVGRDAQRVQALAAEHGCRHQTLAEFLAEETPLRALVAATGCSTPLVTAELARARLPAGAGVVDLGLPRNVAAEVRDHARLADLDDLRQLAHTNSQRLGTVVDRIEGWIEAALARRHRRSAAAPLPMGVPA